MDDLSISQFDLADQQHRHKLELARQHLESTKISEASRVKQARADTTKVIGVTAVCIGGVAGVVFMIGSWIMQPGPPADQDPNVQREITCVDTGGVWIDDSLLMDGDSQCFYPGRKAEDQVKSE